MYFYLYSFLFLSSLYTQIAAAPFGEDAVLRDFVVGQGVQTSSGLVVGKPASSRPAVSEYLGIPFAKPPLGDLRFAAPQAYTGSGTVNATAFVSDFNAISSKTDTPR